MMIIWVYYVMYLILLWPYIIGENSDSNDHDVVTRGQKYTTIIYYSLLILGFIVTESRPIATYLCDKYGKDDKLYPKDLAVRATVNARLYFDIGTFYKAFGDCVVISDPYKEI